MTTDPKDIPGEDPRLDSLEDRLEAARRHEEERTNPQFRLGVAGPGEKTGQRVLSILVGYPVGGGVVGWLLDGWFGTRPWIMLALLFLAFAAACFQVFEISRKPPE